MQYHFPKAFLPDGWHDDVVLTVRDHTIEHVEVGVAQPGADVQRVAGAAIPSMTNVHSHAFQYAFAGLSEYRTAHADDFWTWRALMYNFVATLTPDEVYAIGQRLYRAMYAAGYTTVAEFHYLLHQPGGTPYDNPNEMADALIQAALEAGLRICMLPVFYQRGGFDGRPLEGGQQRFGSSHDLFLRMVDKLNSDWANHPSVRLGVALHSLRAVSIPAAQALLADVDMLLPGCPIHIHVAEQTKEVADCLAATGQRPVELLLDTFDVNERWCLIHATHLTDDEGKRVAQSGAVVGVCPTTEANLGDGVFRAEDYMQYGGNLAVGSDSHISVDACEELRLLEYAQRLTQQRRNVLCTETTSCGPWLWNWAANGGAAVTGFGPAAIQPGASAHLSLIDPGLVASVPTDRLLDHVVFHHVAGRQPVRGFTS